jgi:hypothetical protein
MNRTINLQKQYNYRPQSLNSLTFMACDRNQSIADTVNYEIQTTPWHVMQKERYEGESRMDVMGRDDAVFFY